MARVERPTKGAEAKTERPQATATPPTTELAPQTTTAPALQATVAPETEPDTTEPEPSLPALRPGDGTFSTPVTITLDYPSQVDWRTRGLRPQVSELRLEARATSAHGSAGDVHGVQCTLGRRATYTFLVDRWNETYDLERSRPIGQGGQYVQSGEAAGLVAPPRPSVFDLTCESRADRTLLTLRANGKPVTTWVDRDNVGRFTAVGLTAWSPGGDHEVVLDAVVLETG